MIELIAPPNDSDKRSDVVSVGNGGRASSSGGATVLGGGAGIGGAAIFGAGAGGGAVLGFGATADFFVGGAGLGFGVSPVGKVMSDTEMALNGCSLSE